MSDHPTDADKAGRTPPLPEIAAELQGALGQRLVAYATGVRSPRLIGRWVTGEATEPGDEIETRLRALHRVKTTLGAFHDDRTIRTFLVGANPDLQDRTPIDRIREGHGVDAVRAAQAFLR